MLRASKGKGNIRILSATSFLEGLYSSMVRAIWQPFVLSLGTPMSTLGLLESLGGRGGLATALIQPIGGWFSDRLGRKPLMALPNLIDISALSLYIAAAIVGDWRLLLPGVILIGLAMIRHPAMESLTAESAEEGARGRAYSVLMFSWIVPGVFAPTLGGFIAERWGFSPVFLIRMVLEGLCLFLVVRFLRETLHQRPGPLRLGELRGALGKIPIPPRRLRGFYVAMAADAFVWGLGAHILFGLLSKTYGFTPSQLGIMSSIASLSWAISQLSIGRLIDRYGCKPFLALSELIGFFVAAGWLVSSSFAAFAFLHAFWGLVAATWVPAQLAYLASRVSERERAEAMGRLAAFKGLLCFPAPYIGGLLYDRVGFRGPILANLIGVVIALALILLFVREG